MIHEYPVPDQLNGDGLAYEIEGATGQSAEVRVSDGVLYVRTEARETAVDPIVAAHTGTPTPEAQAELEAQAEDEQRQAQLDQLRDKARAVWNGEDTFTQAQAQKIIAGLVLLELRRRESLTS